MDPTLLDPASFPLAPPPKGTLPNFDHPASLAQLGHVCMGIFMAVTAGFIILRIYVKLNITKQWGWDDGEFSTYISVNERSQQLI